MHVNHFAYKHVSAAYESGENLSPGFPPMIDNFQQKKLEKLNFYIRRFYHFYQATKTLVRLCEKHRLNFVIIISIGLYHVGLLMLLELDIN